MMCRTQTPTLALAILGLSLVAHWRTLTRDAQADEHQLLATPVENRLNYHSAPAGSPAMMSEQHRFQIPSLLKSDTGEPIRSKQQWYQNRRPEVLKAWKAILGKLQPTTEDQKWFPEMRDVTVHQREQRDGYERIHLSLPMETDFMQPHLLLVPTGQGNGPFPAVIAWTSTSPDYRQPEQWWGAWLARRGYVVLTGWSFIRNYRNGADHRRDVQSLVYRRFGHWLPMAKMVHDVQRECQYLSTLPEVDSRRIGFIGFSLSGKAALYVAAFARQITATVAVDPHIALHGATNWHDPWYLDWRRKFPSIHTPDYPIADLRGTVWSLLDVNPSRPGFERNHHELMALCAPRALMVIGCSMDQYSATHSDDAQSWAYVNRAREVYELVGLPERFQFVPATVGHRATDPAFDTQWQSFFERWLKREPIASSEFETQP